MPAGTANGMIFTVATIWPLSTAACWATVATVIAGSTALMASISALSTVNTPADTACRFTRPVAAAFASIFAKASPSTILSAARSSERSSGSSTAAITSVMPAARSTAISSALSMCALRKRRSPVVRACARTAPSASASATGPNLTPLRLSRCCPIRATAAPGSPRPTPQPQSRRGWPRRCSGQSVRGCARWLRR